MLKYRIINQNLKMNKLNEMVANGVDIECFKIMSLLEEVDTDFQEVVRYKDGKQYLISTYDTNIGD